MFCGMNQAWVRTRYFGWSGASICTRLRTRCGLPPVISRTARVGLLADDGGGLVAGVEQRVLAADLQDVGVAGHHPEGVEALGLRAPPSGLVGAQPGVGLVDARVGIGRGIDQRRGEVVGDVEFRTVAMAFSTRPRKKGLPSFTAMPRLLLAL